jgi:hypothetical protein
MACSRTAQSAWNDQCFIAWGIDIDLASKLPESQSHLFQSSPWRRLPSDFRLIRIAPGMGRKFEACPACRPDALSHCPRTADAIECVAGERIMKRIGPGAWSMRQDRELIGLSKTKTLDALVDHFKRPSASILAKAMRLGLSIKRNAK